MVATTGRSRRARTNGRTVVGAEDERVGNERHHDRGDEYGRNQKWLVGPSIVSTAKSGEALEAGRILPARVRRPSAGHGHGRHTQRGWRRRRGRNGTVLGFGVITPQACACSGPGRGPSGRRGSWPRGEECRAGVRVAGLIEVRACDAGRRNNDALDTGRFLAGPIEEDRTGRKTIGEAVPLLVRKRSRLRLGRRETAVPIIGCVGAMVPVVLECDERTGARATV